MAKRRGKVAKAQTEIKGRVAVVNGELVVADGSEANWMTVWWPDHFGRLQAMLDVLTGKGERLTPLAIKMVIDFVAAKNHEDRGLHSADFKTAAEAGAYLQTIQDGFRNAPGFAGTVVATGHIVGVELPEIQPPAEYVEALVVAAAEGELTEDMATAEDDELPASTEPETDDLAAPDEKDDDGADELPEGVPERITDPLPGQKPLPIAAAIGEDREEEAGPSGKPERSSKPAEQPEASSKPAPASSPPPVVPEPQPEPAAPVETDGEPDWMASHPDVLEAYNGARIEGEIGELGESWLAKAQEYAARNQRELRKADPNMIQRQVRLQATYEKDQPAELFRRLTRHHPPEGFIGGCPKPPRPAMTDDAPEELSQTGSVYGQDEMDAAREAAGVYIDEGEDAEAPDDEAAVEVVNSPDGVDLAALAASAAASMYGGGPSPAAVDWPAP